MNGNKINKPITHGVARVPVVMQMEALECGAACLCMIMAYYNKWIPLEEVRADCGVSRDGSNAKNMLLAARSYGMKAEGYRIEPEQLREEGTFPCIIHWDFNHFVVCKGFSGNKVYLNDPARGDYATTFERFDEAFTGICLMIEPSEGFTPGGKPKSVLKFAMSRLTGAAAAIVFASLTAVIASITGIFNAGFA
ncbi:MAG: NHLP family bacteriocin export ABC transporter peptidase/permease/ATPase, partial [Lachnospiraceae bacterium]|nr:NHLP family bacteriocin export ABC transporter peptidase/permease/ATPase [Lachnospiraceae bacterium]